MFTALQHKRYKAAKNLIAKQPKSSYTKVTTMKSEGIMMIIRPYTDTDEQGWLRCRVLAFLNTAYFDNVLQKKAHYDRPSIELVAIEQNKVVGLIDIEYEETPRTICTAYNTVGGMIWHVAVHPDYQHRRIGEKLLEAALKEAKIAKLTYLEAWTRDNPPIPRWYEKMRFTQKYAYHHLYFDETALEKYDLSVPAQVHPMTMFAHYTGSDPDVLNRASRRHLCMCYVKRII